MRWSLPASSANRNMPRPDTTWPLSSDWLAGILACVLVTALIGCGPGTDDADPSVDGTTDTVMEQDVTADASAEPSGTTAALPPDEATAGAESGTSAAASDEVSAIAAEIEDLVAGMFSSAIGSPDPAWQDVTVRRMNTIQLAELRGLPTPQPGSYGRRGGIVWVVGFRTTHTVSADQMFLENMTDFQDLETSELADEEGLTTVYYILSAVGSPENVQITPLSSGIIPPTDPRWSLDDLAEITSR